MSYYFKRPFFWGMSAGRYTPVADGQGKDRHSVFTAALLSELIERADTDRPDHAFTFRELAPRVEARVREGKFTSQIPNWGKLGPGDGDFVFRPTLSRASPRQSSTIRDYSRSIALAEQEWQTGNVDRAAAILAAIPAPQRHWEWHYLSRAVRGDVVVFNGYPRAYSITFSPDGRTVATGHQEDPPNLPPQVPRRGTVKTWNAASGEAILTLGQYTNRVVDLAFSPDGAWIAVAGRAQGARSVDDEAVLLSADQRQKMLKLTGRTTVAFSPDGQKIATAAPASSDPGKKIIISDAATGAELLALRSDSHGLLASVAAIAFSPDGTLLAAGGMNLPSGGSIWNAVTGQYVRSLKASKADCLAFSPDGTRVALGCSPSRKGMSGGDSAWTYRAYVYDLESSAPAVTCSGSGMISSLRFTPDGKRLIGCARLPAPGARIGGPSDPETSAVEVTIWDASSGSAIQSQRKDEKSVGKVAISPDGRCAAFSTGDNPRTAIVWQFDREPSEGTFARYREEISCYAFSPDGKRLATGCGSVKTLSILGSGGSRCERRVSGTGIIKLWDLTSGRESLSLATGDKAVLGIAFSPDSRLVAVITLVDRRVRVWDATSGRVIHTLDGPSGHALTRIPKNAYALAPEDQRLTGHPGYTNGLAFSRDGSRLAAAIGSEYAREGEAKLWDVADGRELLVLPEHTAIAFSPDGSKIAAAGGYFTEPKGIKIYDAASGRLLRTIHENEFTREVLGLVFSPDGNRLALTALADRDLQIYDVATGGELLAVKTFDAGGKAKELNNGGPGGGVRTMAFSPDGTRIVAAGGHRAIAILWDLATGKEIAVLKGHTSQVPHAVFSRDGKRLVTAGGRDGTVRIWDALGGNLLLTLRGAPGAVRSVSLDAEDQILAARTDDNRVWIWDARPVDQLANRGTGLMAGNVPPGQGSANGTELSRKPPPDATGQPPGEDGVRPDIRSPRPSPKVDRSSDGQSPSRPAEKPAPSGRPVRKSTTGRR
jgi:WD40 repeat protein